MPSLRRTVSGNICRVPAQGLTDPMIAKLMRFFWSDTRVGRRIRHRSRYPGLRIDDTAVVIGDGKLLYDITASVGKSSILNIAPGAILKLGEASYIGRHCEVAPGGRITIGRSSSIQDRAVILGDVAIGAYCTLAYNVYMSSGNHVIDWRPALPLKVQDIRAPAISSPVTLEEDCWLGCNVFVKAGIRIGRGAVVGANSVVTRDVPPYAIVAGSPARIIRNRLNYAPPKEIRFEDIDTLPYFHAGFHLLDAELSESRSAGGLLAESSFSVVLDASECSILGIEIRAESTLVAEIEYAGQRHRLKKVFDAYEFKLASITGPFEFKVVGQTAKMRISRVWAK